MVPVWQCVKRLQEITIPTRSQSKQICKPAFNGFWVDDLASARFHMWLSDDCPRASALIPCQLLHESTASWAVSNCRFFLEQRLSTVTAFSFRPSASHRLDTPVHERFWSRKLGCRFWLLIVFKVPANLVWTRESRERQTKKINKNKIMLKHFVLTADHYFLPSSCGRPFPFFFHIFFVAFCWIVNQPIWQMKHLVDCQTPFCRHFDTETKNLNSWKLEFRGVWNIARARNSRQVARRSCGPPYFDPSLWHPHSHRQATS